MRPAFTLVELLVVIALFSLLMMMLLPAIQSARESARRGQCASNLKQIGLALHGFHAACRAFPPGRGGPPPKVFSALAYLLPYLEEGALGLQIDYSQSPMPLVIAGVAYSGAANADAATRTISVLQCPSDVASGRVPGMPYGGTNYAANVGSGTPDAGSLVNADGVFFLTSSVAFRNLSDGSSHTAAFGERMLGNNESFLTITSEQAQLAVLQIDNGVDVTPATCASPSSGAWYSQRGAKWILGNYGNTLYNHYYLPNDPQWDCMNQPQQKGLTAARSNHPGGVQVLFCDGSLRFVADAVDPVVWRAAATRCGNETDDGI